MMIPSMITVKIANIFPDTISIIPNTEDLAEDEIRLTFLGTGMPFPTKSQAAAGVLMEFGNGDILMLDVGSGTVANFNSLEMPPQN